MPGRIFKHERAKLDLIEIYAYLVVRSELAGRRFLAETRKAFQLILEMPGIGKRWQSPISALRELRVTSVSRRFRDCLIFYRPVKGGVQIVTILHGARDLPPIIESLPLYGSEAD
jgi:toxin ParE1/3/4